MLIFLFDLLMLTGLFVVDVFICLVLICSNCLLDQKYARIKTAIMQLNRFGLIVRFGGESL